MKFEQEAVQFPLLIRKVRPEKISDSLTGKLDATLRFVSKELDPIFCWTSFDSESQKLKAKNELIHLLILEPKLAI